MLNKTFLVAVLCFVLFLFGCDAVPHATTPQSTVPPQSSQTPQPSPAPTVTQAPENNRLASMPLFGSISADFDNNGTTEQMSFTADKDEVLTVTLQTAKKDYSVTVSGCQYEQQFTLTALDGKTCVFIVYDMASSDYVTQMIYFNGSALVSTDINGYITKAVKAESEGKTGERLEFMRPIDVFGTWLVTVEYGLNGGFTMEPSNIYRFADNSTVTTAVELTATNANGQETVIPAGSKLNLINTDCASFVNFSFNQKQYAFAIEFDMENYTYIVNGMVQDEAFAGLEYFG